jgi:dipeptidyl aminopeptidase/acylaminoacyl peptidase
VVGLLLAVAFLAGFLVQRRWGQSEPPRFQRLTFRRGHVTNARFTPDGQTIVYSANWDHRLGEIFTTRTDSPESRALGLPPASLHSISPKGEMLLSLTHAPRSVSISYTLARVPLAGGAPRPILEAILPHWADWAPDAETFALLLRDAGESRIEYPRGTLIWRSKNVAWDLRLSPTGDALAFCETRGSSLAVVMVDRAGKAVAQSGGWSVPPSNEWMPRGCVAWAPEGREVWFAAARPGQDFGLYALSRNGEVRPLLHVPGELALYDISPDGSVLLSQVDRRVALAARAPGETEDRDLSWFETSELADLSVDGRWILFTESGQGGGERSSVYLRGTDGSPAVRLGDGKALALSPDGRWALACSATDPRRLSLLPTGAGEPRPLPPTALPVTQARFLPGGKQLLVSLADRLHVMDIGAKEARPLTRPGAAVAGFVPSPDGSWVAAAEIDGINIYPIGGGEPRLVPGVPILEQAPVQWRADGRALYIAQLIDSGRAARIDEVDIATGRRRRSQELRVADPTGSVLWSLVMTPDGKEYAYDARSSRSALYLVKGLR